VAKSEFTVAGAHRYDRRGPLRWILSHVLRYKRFIAGFLLASITANVFASLTRVYIGRAFDEVTDADADRSRDRLVAIVLVLVAFVLINGVFDLSARFSAEILGKRLERDARDELYLSLLGKSQTFHNRQRVGDLMARAANDVRQLSGMIVPGVDLIVDSFGALVVPIVFIGFIDPRLLLSPLLFTVVFAIALRGYVRRLNPVSNEMRAKFGVMNAGLAEAVAGIEVVKSTAQEAQERRKFTEQARAYRDAFVRHGLVEARYLPTLLLAIPVWRFMVRGLTSGAVRG